MVENFYIFTMIVNLLWLGSATWYFCIKNRAAAKVLIPKSARSSPLFSNNVGSNTLSWRHEFRAGVAGLDGPDIDTGGRQSVC